MTSADAYPPDSPLSGAPDQGDDAIIGADDHGGRGETWDDPGGDWGAAMPAVETGAAAAATGAAETAAATGAAAATGEVET